MAKRVRPRGSPRATPVWRLARQRRSPFSYLIRTMRGRIPMSSLSTLEKQPFEELLEMSSGYVLQFTDQTFASFFAESVNCDIYTVRYATYGDSKAKRFRAFWERES